MSRTRFVENWLSSSVTIVQPEPESFRTDENLHFTN